MTAAHSSELQLVRCVRACAGVGDCLAAPAPVEVRQSLRGPLRRSLLSRVSCPYRIGTVNTNRVAANAAASTHRGAIQSSATAA
jgi:hypothetical protein